MKTIDKFVLKSYLGPMILTFFIVIFILMMNFLWIYIDELVGKGLSAAVIAELLMYATINTIPMGLPLATLLAGIMTMGNLGESNELLAMKSAGMSLPRILLPVVIVVTVIAIGSFFVSNNLVPYSNKKMFAIRFDINNQKQAIDFKDGVFFNGIPDMSIRVESQDRRTNLLENVLIYDTRSRNGNMSTTIADSGYIRLSDDKKYLLVTLYGGETYETTRSSQWYENSDLQHFIFQKQDMILPMSGFSLERTDQEMFNNSQTKPIARLQVEIDSLNREVAKANTESYEPLLANYVLIKDKSLLGMHDSLATKTPKKLVNLEDTIAKQSAYAIKDLIASARSDARSSRSMFTFDEDMAKDNINQLYRNQVEWHKKVALPFSIIVFFLIGAPLGAIIRKGGLGMPVVVSVLFFVLNYVISMSGEKMAKEGTISAFEGMWLSLFILLPIAVYLTYKATNDSNLFNMDWYRMQYSKIKNNINKTLKNIKK